MYYFLRSTSRSYVAPVLVLSGRDGLKLRAQRGSGAEEDLEVDRHEDKKRFPPRLPARQF